MYFTSVCFLLLLIIVLELEQMKLFLLDWRYQNGICLISKRNKQRLTFRLAIMLYVGCYCYCYDSIAIKPRASDTLTTSLSNCKGIVNTCVTTENRILCALILRTVNYFRLYLMYLSLFHSFFHSSFASYKRNHLFLLRSTPLF